MRYQFKKFNMRQWTLIGVLILLSAVLYINIHGYLIPDANLQADFMQKNLPPSLTHIFGTDGQGRDMYLRTLKGLSISSGISLLATLLALMISGCLSLCLAVGGKWTDKVITWLIDVFLSLPHMLFLILISVAVGKGIQGVVLGLSLTHWTGLTRLIRAEIKHIKTQDYITSSLSLGKSKYWITTHHILPHLMGQIFVAVILLFPHAMLHESSMSFLGFGLSLSTPAIGIILSEAMMYIQAGYWWLGFFPGLMLVVLMLMIFGIGNGIQKLLNPHTYHS